MRDDDPHRAPLSATGGAARGRVRRRTAETVDELPRARRSGDLRDEIREVLDADDRIPYVRRRGRHLYNFWQDAANPRCVWRRTSRESSRRADPEGEVLLDVDALGRAENENWVWQGATALRPGYRRGLAELSRGGGDAGVVGGLDLEA